MNTERFVVAATSGRRDRADAMLAARPEIERDRWAALVLGRDWDGDANEVGGPREWPPLFYVAHSAYGPVDLARRLLARGADPNAVHDNEWGPISVLFGAVGVARDPELTRALLEGGADPNGEPTFGDALYHSCEAENPACLRVLLEHGAEPNGTVALGHALDFDHMEHVKLLLDAGADPNEHALLAHAVRRGRGPEYLRLLAERGAELDRPGGETWRGDVPLRTPYQQAVIRGRDDQARALADLGASTEVSEEDGRLAALARGEQPDGPLPSDPDAQEVVVLAALHGRLDAVLATVGPNYVGVVGGSPAGTLLHHAAWVGDAALVRTLLAEGADARAPSDAHFSSPAAWAALGSQFFRLPGRDYVGVVEALVGAGSDVEPGFAEVAHGPLEAWLEERMDRS